MIVEINFPIKLINLVNAGKLYSARKSIHTESLVSNASKRGTGLYTKEEEEEGNGST